MNNKSNNDIFEKISKLYKLGKINSTPERIFGGLLHKMWKITTTNGIFAVKILNPEIMKRAEAFDNFIFSEKFSNIAENAKIPAITAISIYGKNINKIDKTYIMVFPWFEGISLSIEPAGEKACNEIGGILAKIHNLGIETSEKVAYGKMEIETDILMNLENDFKGISKIIIELIKKYNENLNTINNNLIVSHRDIDQKNVLWDNVGNPMVIDWESSGVTNPIVELLTAGLYWGGIVNGKVEEKPFKAIIKGYQKIKSLDYNNIEKYIYGCLGFIDWLIYNVKRSNDINIDKEEIKLAKEEIKKTVKAINQFYSNYKNYIKWIMETNN